MSLSSRRLAKTVAVIGAGPVGLAAAAHLAERGITPIVLEAGPGAGAAIGAWGHVRLFSPWRFDIDSAARRLLEGTGWTEPDADGLPLGSELIERYLEPLAAALAPHVRYGTRVTGVARLGADKTHSLGREGRAYLLRTVDGAGEWSDVVADAVIDASGVWGRANPLGANGLPAAGETADAPWQTGPLPDVLGRDRGRFAGKRALVVGAGHSAANTLLLLAELAETEPGTAVTWAIRGRSAAKVYGGGSADALPARGTIGTRLQGLVESGAVALVTGFTIDAFATAADGSVTVTGTTGGHDLKIEADNVAAATGFRPDLELLRELRLDLDAAVEAPAKLAPLIDPNFHSCGTVPAHGEADLAHPDEGFYIAGVKSYGRAPTFLLATGYEQVRSIAAALAGDREAADRVELDLPETGVCSSSRALDATSIADAGESAGCCGTTADADSGCGTAQPEPVAVGARGLATGVLHGRAGERVELPQLKSGCCG
ncbi:MULTISPECIES: FAD-dependent oxidoreductase [Glycomyces]|uniref:FAD-dependent oxidoreductase n=2 Tax=Glycomyces TaxID=58113 RepID=A0A9X3SUN6_9ACTN|nr:FAD-dependent oxidoreductase [Glycomyces lechevalierae]MDA1383822.1 FAD-dependent oxidoreductase [Glycomyces lechevalierae]MDR7341186.1 thioredoxin reductase [Glycomyces lechevalierae]